MDEAEDDEMDTGYTSIDQKVLEFINSAPIEDLSDICGIEPSVAEIVISQRPSIRWTLLPKMISH